MKRKELKVSGFIASNIVKSIKMTGVELDYNTGDTIQVSVIKHSDGVVPNSDENCLDIKDGGE